MATQSNSPRRDTFKFWWPFAVIIFGGSVGTFHIVYCQLTKASVDLGVIGFATLFVTIGNTALNAGRSPAEPPPNEEVPPPNEGG